MSIPNRGDVQIVVLELQPEIVASSTTISAAALRRTAAAIRDIADALRIPLLAAAVPLGDEAPSLVEELGAITPHVRTSISLLGHEDAARQIADHGRRTLAVAGVSSEIAILHTVLDARRAGYDVHLLTDAIGGLSDRGEAAALAQMQAAGAVPSSVASFFTGLVDDMTSTDGQAVMGALAKLWSWNDDHGTALDAGIAALFERMRSTWRDGDAEGFASVFTPQARFVAFDGSVLQGPDAIAAFHAVPFATHLAGSELLLNVREVRSLGADVAMVSSQGGIVRDGEASGDLIGDSAQTFVVRATDAGARIEAFHNTRIRPIAGPQTAAIWKDFDRAWRAVDAGAG